MSGRSTYPIKLAQAVWPERKLGHPFFPSKKMRDLAKSECPNIPRSRILVGNPQSVLVALPVHTELQKELFGKSDQNFIV
jgi:hypothetical protein